MFNIFIEGQSMMEAALKTATEIAERHGIPRPKVLGLTLPTSTSYNDLVRRGIMEEIHLHPKEERERIQDNRIQRYVEHHARFAQDCGLDGVVVSGKEATHIRACCGKEFLIVIPAIRGPKDPMNDQKRAVTPREAILAGADYLVVGRPITKAPSPVEAARKIVSEVASALAVVRQ